MCGPQHERRKDGGDVCDALHSASFLSCWSFFRKVGRLVSSVVARHPQMNTSHWMTDKSRRDTPSPHALALPGSDLRPPANDRRNDE